MIEAAPPPSFLGPEFRDDAALRRALATAEHRILVAVARQPSFWIGGFSSATLLQRLATFGEFTGDASTHLPFDAALESLVVRGVFVLDPPIYRVMGGQRPAERSVDDLAATYPAEVHDVLDERYARGSRALERMATCHPSNVLPLVRAVLLVAVAPFHDELVTYVGRPLDALTFEDVVIWAARAHASTPRLQATYRLGPLWVAFHLYLSVKKDPAEVQATLREGGPPETLLETLRAIEAQTWSCRT